MLQRGVRDLLRMARWRRVVAGHDALKFGELVDHL